MARAVQVFKNSMTETECLRADQEMLKLQAAAEQKAALHKMADGFESKVGHLVGMLSSSFHGVGSNRAVDDRHGGPEQSAGHCRRLGGGGGKHRLADRGLGRRGTDGFDRRDQPPGRAVVQDHRQSGGRRQTH